VVEDGVGAISGRSMAGRWQGSFATSDVDGDGASALVGIAVFKRRKQYYSNWKNYVFIVSRSWSIVWLFVSQRSRINGWSDVGATRLQHLNPTVNSAISEEVPSDRCEGLDDGSSTC
jgi:hypothetical protein